MLRFFNKRIHNRKGFTLIELIVVIAILAILALIAIPRLSAFTKTARIEADARSADLIEKAIQTGIASQKITIATKTFTWDEDGTTGKGEITGGGSTAEAQWVEDHLDAGLKKPQATTAVNFAVAATTGEVTITGLATE